MIGCTFSCTKSVAVCFSLHIHHRLADAFTTACICQNSIKIEYSAICRDDHYKLHHPPNTKVSLWPTTIMPTSALSPTTPLLISCWVCGNPPSCWTVRLERNCNSSVHEMENTALPSQLETAPAGANVPRKSENYLSAIHSWPQAI